MEENNNFQVNQEITTNVNLPDERPKKTNKKIIAGITAVVVIAAATGLYLKFGAAEPADVKAKNAFEKMSEENAAYSISIAQDLDMASMREYAKENPVHASLDLSATMPDNDTLGNISLSIDEIIDAKNKSFDAAFKAGAYGLNFSIGNVIYDDKTVYIKSDYLGDSAYKLELENFTENFNGSSWASLLGVEVTDEISDAIEAISDSQYMVVSENKTNDSDVINSLISEIKENAGYSLLKDKKEFIINEKTVKCSGIEVVIGKEYVNELNAAFVDMIENAYASSAKNSFSNVDDDEFTEAVEQLKTIEPDDDLRLVIYLDSKGRIVNIATSEDIGFTSNTDTVKLEAVSFNFNFTGTERALDSFDGEIYIKEDGNVNLIEIERNAEVTSTDYTEDIKVTVSPEYEDSSMVFVFTGDWNTTDNAFDLEISVSDYDGAWSYGVSASGSFDDIVTGESYTLNLNNAKFSADGENVLIISGKYTQEPTDDTVEVPKSSIDLLEMSEDEIEEMFYTAIGNIY